MMHNIQYPLVYHPLPHTTRLCTALSCRCYTPCPVASCCSCRWPPPVPSGSWCSRRWIQRLPAGEGLRWGGQIGWHARDAVVVVVVEMGGLDGSQGQGMGDKGRYCNGAGRGGPTPAAAGAKVCWEADHALSCCTYPSPTDSQAGVCFCCSTGLLLLLLLQADILRDCDAPGPDQGRSAHLIAAHQT